MASEVLKKIGKGILIGAGTVLSMFAPAVGAPLVVAGTAIQTHGPGSSVDKISMATSNLMEAQNIAGSMVAGSRTYSTVDNVIKTITANPLPWLAGAGVLYYLFTRKKR